MSRRQLVIQIIKEMQEELDAFFRSKKAKMVKLTSDDLVYLEVMLAQAVGPLKSSPSCPSSGDDCETVLGFCTQRFLREFFMLKTKCQVHLKDSSFKMVRAMVDHTLERALHQVRNQSSSDESVPEEDRILVPETDCESGAETAQSSPLKKSPLDTRTVKRKGLKKLESVFQAPMIRARKRTSVGSRLFGDRKEAKGKGDSSWLRRRSLNFTDSHSTPDSPLARRNSTLPASPTRSPSRSDSGLCIESPSLLEEEDVIFCLLDMQKRLPIKKRRSSTEAIVPTSS